MGYIHGIKKIKLDPQQSSWTEATKGGWDKALNAIKEKSGHSQVHTHNLIPLIAVLWRARSSSREIKEICSSKYSKEVIFTFRPWDSKPAQWAAPGLAPSMDCGTIVTDIIKRQKNELAKTVTSVQTTVR